MERKIGEVFEYQGKKFKVVKATSNLCNNCNFYDDGSCKVVRQHSCGECDKRKRIDGISVIFVEVKEEAKEQQQDEQKEGQLSQKLNLCEILKHCPQGELFWSPLFGDVVFWNIDQDTKKINVRTTGIESWYINADGTITIDDITSEDVMLYPSREQRDWSKVKYKPKKELPRTWYEFCATHNITMSEYFIGETGNIFNSNSGLRIPEISKTILSSEEAAKAHLAYMQLHQLRDAWREGWLPDWKDDNQNKYVIFSFKGECEVFQRNLTSHFLAFQDEKRADEFKDCFINLIREAGDLI